MKFENKITHIEKLVHMTIHQLVINYILTFSK